MDELELVGLHDDGEHIVLAGPDGTRYRLRVDESLRAAARRDRPRLELLRAEGGQSLPPREIQSRIRAGQSAADVAEAAGLAVEDVRRYEGPVLAEREFIATQARSSSVGREPGSPALGELVLDRLAARGVDPESVRWDAFRATGEPWTVVVRFVVGSQDREARWHFDHQLRVVTALEDEARWLSETQLADEPIPRRHLAAVRDVVFDVASGETGHVLVPLDDGEPDLASPEDESPEEDATAALLAELSGKRGVRQEIEILEDEEEFEGFGPQHAFDFGDGTFLGAHPAHSDPDSARDARVLTLPSAASPAAPEPSSTAVAASGTAEAASGIPGTSTAPDGSRTDPDAARSGTEADRTGASSSGAAGSQDGPGDEATPDAEAPRARSRKGRASVPSWDEIVFGARREQ